MNLDHIYFALISSDFERECLKYPPSAFSARQTVKTSDEEWEGLYIRCRDKTYFELLNERRCNKLGIGFRSVTPMENGAPAEVKSMAHLRWQYGTRYFTNGQFWFNWFSLADYRDLGMNFNFWIMQYSAEGLSRMNFPLPAFLNSPFSSLEAISVKAPHALKRDFKNCSQFFSEFQREDSSGTSISLGDTRISIEWSNPKTEPLELLSYGFKK